MSLLFEQIEAGHEKEEPADSESGGERQPPEEDCLLPYEIVEGETL